jgi:hypothetical protein
MSESLQPQAASSTLSERRGTTRLPAELRAQCRAKPGAGPDWEAIVHDLSSGGVSLRAAKSCLLGSVLAVRLHHRADPVETVVRVLHVRPLGKREFIVGGSFTQKLTDEQLQSLL